MTRSIPILAALAALVAAPLPAAAADPLPHGEPAWLGPPAPARPARVISLAPSLTDTVVALGETGKLVGVTRYDTAPEVKSLPRVGGFLDPNPEAVLGLRPDLVLWLADGGAYPAVRRIAELGVPVLALPVVGVPDVLRAARRVGAALGNPEAGERLAASMEAAVRTAEGRASSLPRRRVLLVIGRDPLVVAGPGSYPDALLRIAGGVNVVTGNRPWPVYSLERAVADDPDLVVDAAVNEPADTIARLSAIPAVKAGRVVRLPDDRVLRPGPQLPAALEQLQGALGTAAAGSRAEGCPVTQRRLALALGAGLVALLACVIAALLLGPQPISLSAALAGVEPDRAILLGLRLPRVILGALVGAALAAAGVALQALLRNPLAEPFVLGVSGGAALGGTAALAAAAAAGPGSAIGAIIGSGASVALGASVGAAGSTVLVFALGRIGGKLVPEAALLVGVVFNAFAAGVITVVKVMVPPEEAARLLYWLMGAVGYADTGTLVTGAIFVAVAVAVLVATSAQLNLLSLGDDEASSLGVDVGRSRGVVFLAASLATGAAVALAGLVGFVGLIVPHLLRQVFGPDHRILLPASVLFGAAFLVLADAAARLAFLPLGSEPPVGALTALLGGPLFLWLLRRTERSV